MYFVRWRDSEMARWELSGKKDIPVVLWLTGTSTFRKNDILVVSYPQCKSGVIIV